VSIWKIQKNISLGGVKISLRLLGPCTLLSFNGIKCPLFPKKKVVILLGWFKMHNILGHATVHPSEKLPMLPL
jgi:hypothetical protein